MAYSWLGRVGGERPGTERILVPRRLQAGQRAISLKSACGQWETALELVGHQLVTVGMPPEQATNQSVVAWIREFSPHWIKWSSSMWGHFFKIDVEGHIGAYTPGYATEAWPFADWKVNVRGQGVCIKKMMKDTKSYSLCTPNLSDPIIDAVQCG